MRNRRQPLDLHTYLPFAISAFLLFALALLIWFVPPSNMYIILIASLLSGGSLYTGCYSRIGRRNAFLGASAFTLSSFVYLVGMLDLINGIILICFLISLGILMHQK